MNTSNLITTTQVKNLRLLGFDLILVPTVDEVIDLLRKKHNIIIYNKVLQRPRVSVRRALRLTVPPFVDPCTNRKIMYKFGVKQCNLRDGRNGRITLRSSSLTENIYRAKREAITIAIRFLKNEKLRRSKRKSI